MSGCDQVVPFQQADQFKDFEQQASQNPFVPLKDLDLSDYDQVVPFQQSDQFKDFDQQLPIVVIKTDENTTGQTSIAQKTEEQAEKLKQLDPAVNEFETACSKESVAGLSCLLMREFTNQQKIYTRLEELKSLPENQLEQIRLQEQLELSSMKIERGTKLLLSKIEYNEKTLSTECFASLTDKKQGLISTINAIRDFETTFIAQIQKQSYITTTQKKDAELLTILDQNCCTNLEKVNIAITQKVAPNHTTIQGNVLLECKKLPIEELYAYSFAYEPGSPNYVAIFKRIEHLEIRFEQKLDRLDAEELRKLQSQLDDTLHHDPTTKFSEIQLTERNNLLKTMKLEIADQLSGERRYRLEQQAKIDAKKQEMYLFAKNEIIKLAAHRAKTDQRTSMPDCWSFRDKYFSNAAALWRNYDDAQYFILYDKHQGDPQKTYVTLLHDRFVVKCFQAAQTDTQPFPFLKEQTAQVLVKANDSITQFEHDYRHAITPLTDKDISNILWEISREEHYEETHNLGKQIKSGLIKALCSVGIGTQYGGANGVNVQLLTGPFAVAQKTFWQDQEAEANQLVGLFRQSKERCLHIAAMKIELKELLEQQLQRTQGLQACLELKGSQERVSKYRWTTVPHSYIAHGACWRYAT